MEKKKTNIQYTVSANTKGLANRRHKYYMPRAADVEIG